MEQNYEEQMFKDARKVLRSLLLGTDPDTYQRLSPECVVMQAEVKTALALGIEALQTTEWVRKWKAKKASTSQTNRAKSRVRTSTGQDTRSFRAGQGWTPPEDKDLHQGFRAGRTLHELCQAHGRTAEGIMARLVRLGLVSSKYEAKEAFRKALLKTRL